MEYIKNCLWGVCLSFILLTVNCGGRQTLERDVISLSELPPVDVSVYQDSVMVVRDWLAVGPFTFNPLLTDPVRSFFRNDLRRYRVKEGMIDGAGVERLQKRGADVFLINELSPQIRLFKYMHGGNMNKMSNAYLVARIHSNQAREATLIMDGSYSYAVWLNGDKLLEVTGKYNVNKAGNRFVNVSLKEGENLLSVKVSRGTNRRSWDLICAIGPRQKCERIFRVNYTGDFVVNPVVSRSLEVYAGPYHNGRVEVADAGGQPVAASSFENLNTNDRPFIVAGFNKLADGFYKVALSVGGARMEQMIYKGDYKKFVAQAKAKVAAINAGTPYVSDLKAALQRVEFLNDKPQEDVHSPDETRFVNRNRVYWGCSLSEMLRQDALTQLMTYQDEVGDSGVFIFHKGVKRQTPLPLVIIVPSGVTGDSMIADWYTGNLDQIETDNAIADEYGFAVAWIYAGGRNYSAAKTEKEITAVINRLQSEDAIDPQKIFIMGDCEGGRRALVQLALSPDRYAACVVSSPITLSGGSDGTPINLIEQMGRVPILIRHGADDDVSPVENSRRFNAEAQRLNLPVIYEEVAGSHINYINDEHRFVFEFFNFVWLKYY